MRRWAPALLALGAATAAAARAGGGQGYSGGGSFGGSYHSSGSSFGGGSYHGSGGGDLVQLALWLVFAHPFFGVPLVLVVLYVIWNIDSGSAPAPLRAGDWYPSRGLETQLDERKAAELAKIRERDPGFDEAAFVKRATAAFLKVQEAWSAGDMAPARAFVSDGVDERFGRQLAELRARGVRNLVERVSVRGVRVLAARADARFDSLWVAFSASAADRMIPADAPPPADDGRVEPFEEVWTFLRRPGARTRSGGGLYEGRCPSCGSPMAIADAARCPACKSWVNSGEYDWVLAEITQACEWSLREPARDVDGWRAASAEDPDLSLPPLEDRVSAVFWRWLEARRRGDAGPLRGVADEAFCAAFGADAARRRAWFADAAVGAAEVVAFEDAGEWRKVHVAVKWSGAQVSAEPGAEPGTPELRRHFFTLKRAKGARTDARQGLRTARCPACGAPSGGRDEPACAYCGGRLCDPRKDWTLDAVTPFGEWRRPVPLGEPAAPRPADGAALAPAEAYAALAKAMLADGSVALHERAFLDAFGRARGLSDADAARLLAAVSAGTCDVPEPEDPAQAAELLRALVRMSLADGVVTPPEEAALRAFAARHAIPPERLAEVVAEQRVATGLSA